MTYSQGLETRQDHQLLRRAATQRWPISGAMRERSLTILEKIIGADIEPENTDKTRNQIDSIKTMISMDRLNLEEDKILQPQQHHHLHILTQFDELTDRELQIQIMKVREDRQLTELSKTDTQDILFITEDDIDAR